MAARTVQLSNRLVAIVVRVARADVAELADAHGSGPCGGNPVEVRVLSSACKLLLCRDLTATAGHERDYERLADHVEPKEERGQCECGRDDDDLCHHALSSSVSGPLSQPYPDPV